MNVYLPAMGGASILFKYLSQVIYILHSSVVYISYCYYSYCLCMHLMFNFGWVIPARFAGGNDHLSLGNRYTSPDTEEVYTWL